MSQYRETCHCSHDKSSHYREFGVQGAKPMACLCCDCKEYVNEFDPKPKKVPERPERPEHRGGCQCYRCKQWREALKATGTSTDKRDTLPIPYGNFPNP